MAKISLFDTPVKIITEMSEGNPGAMTVVMQLMDLGNKGEFKAITTLLFLDTLEVYGSRLYMLWNDCCDRDINVMMDIVKQVQQGSRSHEDFNKHIGNGDGRGVPFA